MQKRRKESAIEVGVRPKDDLSLLEAMVRQRAANSGRPAPRGNTTPLAASVKLPYRPKNLNIQRLEEAVAEIRALELG